MTASPSIDTAEIARFEAMAAEWWDEHGKFKPLHKLNPARLGYIRDRLCARFGRDATSPLPLKGLRIADIGCGGGLTAEPLARLGAAVTGIDASDINIGIAETHAASMGLAIDYRAMSAEALAAGGDRFDAVLALEVIEHVADRAAFMGAVAALVRPGGAALLSTINRTVKSYAFAIIGAEYVLGWLPRGTHQWNKFVRPAELDSNLRQAGLRLEDLSGLGYDIAADSWRVTGDLSVNYLAFATRGDQD